MPINHHQPTTINTLEFVLFPYPWLHLNIWFYDMVSNLPGRSRIRGSGEQKNVRATGIITQRIAQCHSSAPVREINIQERSLYFNSCVPHCSFACLCWTNSNHPGPTFQDMQPPKSHPKSCTAYPMGTLLGLARHVLCRNLVFRSVPEACAALFFFWCKIKLGHEVLRVPLIT